MKKKSTQYRTIGEVARLLNLVDNINGKLMTHTIRYWEKEFKQIKPKLFAGRRRYYDDDNIALLKKIKFLLKDRGMTIKGVKKALNSNIKNIDESNNININTKDIKEKIKKISIMIKKLKE